MTEATLNALMKLFAILANLNKEAAGILSRNFVESFLKTQFSHKLIEHALGIFDEQFILFAKFRAKSETKRTTSLSVQIIFLCNQINNELPVKDRYLILFSLIRFSKFFEDYSGSEKIFRQTVGDAVKAISDGMHIDPVEYENCRFFLLGQFYKIRDKECLLILNNENTFPFTHINHLYSPDFKGQLFFLRIKQANIIIFYYQGKRKLELNGKLLFSDHIYILPRGSSIRGEDLQPVYFNKIESAFLKKDLKHKVSLVAKNIKYTFSDSENGIQPLNLSIGSGEFVGVMGGSGSGKTTLMNMLNGRLPLDSGEVLINGHSIHQNNKDLKKIIGYVPQEDLLISELTVFQNLYYSSLLSIGQISSKTAREQVNRMLMRLDLHHIKDLKVGSITERKISGGQRKRLNIALELIREPYVLFSDEPTSGLSSTDSENVMDLLKELTLQGKIVMVNIHQPSSSLFKMFDKILILDQGGYPVYFGNPVNAFSYLKNVVKRADKEEIECESCGNIQTGDILKIIESKKVNEYGEYTLERSLSPGEWYRFYRESEVNSVNQNSPDPIPTLSYNNPSRWKQFKIYSVRNFLAKISDLQFVLFALIIPPLLGLILGFFTKNVESGNDLTAHYIFSENENLPAYIFMSVIVALFIGLIISADEIIKDRPVLKRESFLNLSRMAYLNSKILFLFVLTALQMGIFVIIGNAVLEIKGLNFEYWLVLFSTASFAVLLGLNISSGLKSLIAVYINIPFILIPLILLAGVIVEYDKLHYKVSSQQFVPLAGDLMASRWAYEALIVNQFLNNDYQKNFNHIDKEKANLVYEVNFFIPEVLNQIRDYIKFRDQENEIYAEKCLKTIRNSLLIVGYNLDDKLMETGDPELKTLEMYLLRKKKKMTDRIRKLNYEGDQVVMALLENGMSEADIVDLKKNYQNESIKDLVLNSRNLRKLVAGNNMLVRKDAPVFQPPVAKNGRAHFYAGTKRIFNLEMDTLWFNILVIWTMSSILYVALYFKAIKTIIERINTRKIKHFSLMPDKSR
ncbi:MAG: ATP-binding cassette domain-containing protein [Bacteroidota bacterium]